MDSQKRKNFLKFHTALGFNSSMEGYCQWDVQRGVMGDIFLENCKNILTSHREVRVSLRRYSFLPLALEYVLKSGVGRKDLFMPILWRTNPFGFPRVDRITKDFKIMASSIVNSQISEDGWRC